jgi:hypothetical protein
MRFTVIGMILFLATPASSEEVLHRVVTVDRTLGQLVADGRERSATLRDLIDRIEAHEWMVFVQPGTCPDRAAIGCMLHVIGTFEGRRYVRVLVNPRGRHRDQVLVTLAHELQHAMEVIASGTVTDGASLIALLETISSSRVRVPKAVLYETAEARRVEESAFRELRQR